MQKYFYKKLILLLYLGYLFSNDSAFTIGQNNRQIGLFNPYVMANKTLEISTHPILFFIKPNFRIKKYLGKKYNFDFAGRFSFDYPTNFLKLIQREGEFGILSIDPTIKKIPHLFTFQSELLSTKKIASFNITNKIGFSFCPGCDLDSRNIVDLPVIYPRMKLYENKILSNIGFDLEYLLSDKIILNTDLDFLMLPKKDIFIEHKFLLNYLLSKKISLTTGYKLAYGKYPYGKQLDLYPLIDISFHWSRK